MWSFPENGASVLYTVPVDYSVDAKEKANFILHERSVGGHLGQIEECLFHLKETYMCNVKDWNTQVIIMQEHYTENLLLQGILIAKNWVFVG